MKKLLLLYVFTATVVLTFAQTPYWSYGFDGGALTDGQGNDDLTASTNTFTTVTDRFSQANDAVSLDGDSLVGGQEGANDYSISFWIKDAPNDAQLRALVHQFSDFGYSMRLENGQIKAVVRMAYGHNGIPLTPYISQTRTLTSPINVADGNWHHVVLVANHSKVGFQYIYNYSLFIDGVLEDTDASQVDIISFGGGYHIGLNNSQTFYVGAHQTGSLVRYEDKIDDIDFYKSALSASQVSSIYNARIPQIVYVDKDATGGANDGSSWADAFTSLKDATDFATMAGDEIWVADGVYTPHPSDRSIMFEISDDVSLYGGFNGTETQLSQRDWRTNESILSGDLSGNDNNNVSYTEATRSENSYKVVFANGNNVLIDGVIVEGGQANNTGTFGEERGSAIYMTSAATTFTLKNSTIRKNVSRVDGSVRTTFTGGSSNSVSIQSCRFENNLSRYGSGLTSTTSGNGTTSIEILNSEFYNNRAADVASSNSGLTGSSIALFANDATVNAEIINNTFAYNKDYGTASGQDKGTVVLRRLNNNASNVVNAEVHNNIFYQNEVSAGNVTTKAIGLMNRPSNPIDVINFTNNNSGQNNFGTISSSGTVSGNIDLDPLFADGANGDFTLLPGSPMIDAGASSQLPGTITEDIAGNTRILAGGIDIGANENDPNACFPIAQQPQDDGACVGETAFFEVVSSDIPNASYQWYFNGNPISGETSSTLTINNVQNTDIGNYYVDVTIACGSESSQTVELSLNSGNPTINTQPSDRNSCEGSYSLVEVYTTTPNATYQWYKDGVLLPGETGFRIIYNAISFADAGDYFVEISAPGLCTINSDTATLNVVPNFIAPTQEPQDVITCAGQTATFYVELDLFDVPHFYQWYRDGIAINGATDSVLTLTNVQPIFDEGNYTVDIIRLCGSYGSAAGELTVVPATNTTSITGQPSSQTACPGDNVTFTVTATGANLIYQWKKNGTNISGATSASLTLNNVSNADAADYTVEVSGDCGSETSNIASLTLGNTTLITSQPSNETICEGGNVTFSASATGSNLSYQWKKDGTNISGATSTSLSISNAQISDAGDYTVEISGDCGTETSNIATLTVNPGVNISQQPADETACDGDDVTLSVTASGAGLSYQWKKDGANISGATSASLTLNSVDNTDAASYIVEITSSCGTITSTAADLTVNGLTSISTQPSNETACEGSNITLSVVATGSNLSYQWTKDGSNISGANAASLVLNNAQLSDAGDYEVIVTGDCGTETSSTATVTINQGISVTQQPSAQSACDGDDVTFTVAATGTGLSYQWTKDGNAISGATSTSLQLNSVSSADAGDYSVEITASCGTLTSNTAALTVNTLTAISTQPSNETTCEGGNITLSVVATGANLTYQWTKDGSNISGATAASLALNNAQLSDAGDYEVVVTGICGSETSSTATVTVNQGISITQQPTSSSACPGDNVQFDLVATGTGLTYQWFKDNNSINGATSTSLSLSNVQAADAGDYSVEITASCGTVSSNVAALTIGTPTAITQQPAGIIVCEGVDTSLTVVANGSNLTYQWNFNGSPIVGATNPVLSLTNVQTSNDGSYTVDIIGDCGTLTSTSVAVAVTSNASFNVQPGIFDPVCFGDTVTLSSSVLGNTFGSQWLLNGDTIPGETGSDITIENITVSDTGNYVREVTGECGVFYSVVVNLNPEPNTSIISQPTDTNVCAGDQVEFTIGAEGGNLSYEWFFNGNSIGTVLGNTNVVTAAADSTDEGFYYAVVTGECGIAQSDSVQLSVITLNPQISESNGTLSTGVFDSYQWFFNGNAINGATNQNFTPTQNGAYSVEVVSANTCSVLSDTYTFVGTSIRMTEIVNLKVYPNPAKDFIQIKTDADLTEIKLYNLSGKLISEYDNTQRLIRFSDIAKGIYYLKLNTKEHSSIVKLALQ